MIDINNILALLAGTIVYMVVGFIWYGPLFAKPWMKLIGKTEKDLKKANMSKLYTATIVIAFVSTYVLATLIAAIRVTTFSGGFQVGLLIGIGLVASASLTTYLFEGRPMKLFLINYGYHVVALAINGGILAVWR